MLTPRLREILLHLGSALLGFAIAVALMPYFERPAPAGQLPALMTTRLGLDARASFRFMAALLALVPAAAFALRPVVARLAAARAWSRVAFGATVFLALWHTLLSREMAWTIGIAAAGIGASVLLRHVDARFGRRDAILVPAVATTFLALTDITALPVQDAFVLAVSIVFAIRIAVVFVRRDSPLPPAAAFAIVPLALILQSHFLPPGQRYAGWPVLAIVAVTPFIVRIAARTGRWESFVAWVAYPLAAFAYVSAVHIATAEGKPRAIFFEHAQHATPASELLRGERPYVDIVPPHGLIQDALADYAIFATGPDTLGRILRTRVTLNCLNGIAIYALGAAAAGSPHVGILGFFLAAMTGSAEANLRFLPSLATLALLAAAMRRRDRRLLGAAAAMAIVAGLTSLEFGVYTAAAVLFGAWRMRAMKTAVVAGGIAGGLASLALLSAGILGAFFRVSIFEVATLGPVYALPPFAPTDAMKRFLGLPEMLTAVFDPQSFLVFVWIGNLLALAVVAGRGMRATGRKRAAFDALLVIALWIALAGFSYAERHNFHFRFMAWPLLVAVTWRLLRARSTVARHLGAALAVTVLLVAQFTSHVAIDGWLRRTRTITEPGWRELSVPRARGAWFREKDAAIVESVQRYVSAGLGPGETFYDFTNRGLLYFLLDRDCPVRQIEVAFYQTEERQREVIDRIARNPRVRAAIVPKEGDGTGVDGVPNPVRAPRVWNYLRENFEPAFEEGDVVIWKRKKR